MAATGTQSKAERAWTSAWSRISAQSRSRPVDHRRLRLRALQDQAGVGLVRRERDRLVEQRLVSDDAARLEAAARRQDRLRLGVVDPGGQFARGEAAEHHGMNGADARAGEHRDGRFRHHRHVEHDAVALADAEVAQHAAEHLRLGQQPMIGDGALYAGERRIVDDRGLLAAPGIDVAVDGVEAGVADAADKPAAVDAGLGIEHRFRLFEPVDVGRRLAPKALRIALPARVDLVITARTGVHNAASRVSASFSTARRRLQAVHRGRYRAAPVTLAPRPGIDLCQDARSRSRDCRRFPHSRGIDRGRSFSLR